jgi:hypothetical protein
MFRAADRYDAEDPGLGDRFLASVERTLEGIILAPLRWPRIDDRHHRRLVARFPFSVIYRIEDDIPVVVAVAHHKRHPDHWRQR